MRFSDAEDLLGLAGEALLDLLLEGLAGEPASLLRELRDLLLERLRLLLLLLFLRSKRLLLNYICPWNENGLWKIFLILIPFWDSYELYDHARNN